MIKQVTQQKFSMKAWIKKISIAGFLFFLLKGLLWLFIGYIVTK